MKAWKSLGILSIVIILAIGGVLWGGWSYLQKQSQRDTYFPNTTINGEDVSDQRPQQVASRIVSAYTAPTVVLRENGEDAISGTLESFGYTFDREKLENDLEECLQKQKDGTLTLIDSLMNGGSFTVKASFSYDPAVLASKVNAAALPTQRVKSVDSEMRYDEKKKEYYLTQEVYGTEFSDQELQNYVKTQIDTITQGETPGSDLTLEFPADLYIPPEVTSDDIVMNNEVNQYNQFTKSKITYTFGSQTEVVDWNKIKGWLSIENGTAVLDEEAIYEYVVELAAKYNTRYYDRTFYTTMGTEIVIPGEKNTYGYTIDEDAEFSQLLGDIKANTETTREPIYIETTWDGFATPVYYERDGQDDLAGNYVEVNLSMQHLWFYRNGGLVVESDLVSGCVARNAQTNTGVFPLPFKESPAVLVGDNAADGYRTTVQYWMPFSDGQGLHDATWRGSFGGQIYINNGSHGCLNLPLYAAAAIFENIEAGMAIIIYE